MSIGVGVGRGPLLVFLLVLRAKYPPVRPNPRRAPKITASIISFNILFER